MKYKLLLTGANSAIIDDFFIHLDENFEFLTTSSRFNDVMSHLKYVQPDAFIICLNNEKDTINSVLTVKNQLENDHIPLIIIGNQEECNEFEKKHSWTSDLTLVKPLSVSDIGKKIVHFLEEWQKTHIPKAPLVEEKVTKETTESFNSGFDNNDIDNILAGLTKIMAEPPSSQDAEIPQQKKHILVVDDDPLILKLIKEYLKDFYTVGTAINGTVALKFLEKKETDLIILDYEMPGENGAQVLEKLRKKKETSHLPVIFLTGINDREKIEKVLALQPQGYLLKPVDRDKMLELIRKTIG